MAGNVQERYTPEVVGVNTTLSLTSNSIGGFLCKTSGTITVTTGGVGSVTIIDAFPVTAGVYYPLPFYIGNTGGTFTTAGGASGTLAGG